MFIEKENNLNESNSTAEKACRKALAEAGYAFGVPVSFHWTQLINPLGQKQVAIDAYASLLEEEPDNKSALEGLAYLNQIMGHQDLASYYRRKLKEVEVSEYNIAESNRPEIVDYLLAKTGEAKTPDRVPSGFVSSHFDKYAEIFEASLVDELEYIGPSLILQEVDSLCSSQEGSLQILDLGCGTGLVGEALKSYSKSLIGLDLSGLMLEKAAARDCYTQLYNDDCLVFLENNNEQYDLITASDVFIYLGNLSSLFDVSRKRLNSNGLLVFTIENTDVLEYKLSNTGRYKHNVKYVQGLAKKNNFEIVTEKKVALRKEQGEAVDATLFCLKV